LQAALIYSGLGTQAAVAFGIQGEINDHDCVLLDDADQQNDAEE